MVNPPNICPHCAGWHTGQCPRVKAIEYFQDGRIKRVEYHQEQPYVPQTRFDSSMFGLRYDAPVECHWTW